MPCDDSLTDEQRTAASHVGTHARLLAGPGTGKTLTLTRRIVFLVSQKKIPPGEVLVLTFTRAAVAELRTRINDALGETTASKVSISTLHSFALRELLKRGGSTRLPQPLRIADDWEERWIIFEEVKRLVGKDIKETRNLFQCLSADWQKLAADRSGWEREFPEPKFLGAWREHRQIYGYTLRSELVYQLKNAIEEGNVDLDAPIKHVLIDEYQDLNPCDLAIANILGDAGLSVYAAGDDDQSIYGFRYANPEGIRRFPKEFKSAQNFVLDECKRCDDSILQLGLFVAKQDPRREDKPLHSVSPPRAGEVHLLRFQDQGYEAAGIARICKWLTTRKKINPEAILILIRSDRNRAFSQPLRAALLSETIPVGVHSNPLEPLERPDGRNFVSILRLAVNPQDDLAWRSLIEVRQNRIGATTSDAVYELARTNNWRYTKALSEIRRNPTRIPRSGPALVKECDEIAELLNRIGKPPKTAIMTWLEGAAKPVISDDKVRDLILDVFRNISKVSGADSLDPLMKAMNVSLGDFEQERPQKVVSVMTMHQAKGLTADAVFVVAAEDEYVPGRYTSGDLFDDERRLLYVSLTRACHFLYVTYATQRTGAQQHTGRTAGTTRRQLTRFLSGGPTAVENGDTFVAKLR